MKNKIKRRQYEMFMLADKQCQIYKGGIMIKRNTQPLNILTRLAHGVSTNDIIKYYVI